MNDKLSKLVSLCKCGVEVSINPHRSYYETAGQHIRVMEATSNLDESDEVIYGMISRDTIVHVQCYPHTPIGFYSIYHYDLETAIDRAIYAVENDLPR